MNIKKTILILFFSTLFFAIGYSQTWDTKVNGTVTNIERVQIPNIPVFLFENQDTLLITATNDMGEYSFDTTFSASNNYYLSLEQGFYSSKTKIFLKGDTSRSSIFEVDLCALPIIRDHFKKGAHYELNEIHKHDEFDIDFIKQLLKENRGLCLEFRQSVNSLESKETASLRMKEFKNEINQSGINMDQLVFSTKVLTLNLPNSEDQRSRIEPIVISIEGKCKF